MTNIVLNLQAVRDRITTACIASVRDAQSVHLVAVSKKFGPDAVLQAVAGGQRLFGENYIAEGVEKIAAVTPRLSAGVLLEWHCIGPVQSNKTRLVAEHFDWVQSIDRLKTAQRLSEHRPEGRAPLQVCIQVNIDGGGNKSGVPPGELEALAIEIAQLPGLQLRGIMAIPEPTPDFLATCAVHQKAKALLEQINSAGRLPLRLDTLSIGMTDDLEAAIHEGSTMLRVGTAIFGSRS